MKKLIPSLGLGLALLGISATAFAAYPVCSAGVAKGSKCTIGSTNYVSCGDGSFIKATNYAPGACDSSWIVRYDPSGNPIRNTRQPSKQEAAVQ